MSELSNLNRWFFQHVAQTSSLPLALEIEKAQGIYLYSKNKKYIDCISGIAVSNLGHANPIIIDAIKTQIEKYSHLMVYGEIIQLPQVQLAKKLAQNLPDNLSQTYFVNSGSEAIEGAMKLAKKYTGKHRFVAQKNAYHGSTHGALSLMSDSYFSNAFSPLLNGIDFINQNDLREINTLITDETAAVFIEPIMGEVGYLPCNLDYLKAIRERCNQTGTLLIFDEIQSGYGRTGTLFAFQHFEIVPDVLVLAKAFGAGLPLGAFISSPQILSCLTDNPVLGHITTYGGNPVCCAASLAALNYITESDILNTISFKENVFKSNLKHPLIKSISGKGLMIAIEFENPLFCRKVIDLCVEKGLLIDWFLYNESKIRLCPPLIINESEILEICGIIIESINFIEATFLIN